MDIVVREYGKKDFDSVSHILQEAFSVSKKEFDGSVFHEIVLEYRKEVVGYLLLTKVYDPIKDLYYHLVDYVCIDSRYHNIGFGKQLMNYAIEFSKNLGVSYMQLTCRKSRLSAHKLYESCGFIMRESDIYRKEFL
ncbi:MAG: GNAT family N-acetyltransferase [Bacilli bacterium]|nr:GNAT family N-acetyltransferase [Bacilli bacterium]